VVVQSDQPSVRQRWLPVVKIGTWFMGIATVVGLIADLPAVFGFPETVFAVIGLLVGVTVTGLGCVLFGREWNRPLRWQATKAAATISAGTALCAVSLVGLVPELIDGLGRGSATVPITLRYYGEFDLDPDAIGSEPDVRLYGEALETPNGGSSVFVRATKPTTAACSSARGWAEQIKPVQDLLICVKTDTDRFVVIEILSYTGNTVTFRIVAESPSPKS
jgi:hypothetical protein